jgi:acetyl esterase/lipase
VLTRRSLLNYALAGGAGVLQGCSPFTLINGLAPADTYRATTAILYGAHPRHKLDVYQPASQPRTAPVVVFFYGGNWNSGERADYLFAAAALASKGYVAVLPDYRLYPEVRYPDFLTDSAQAVRWVFDNIAGMGGDTQQVFLMGHSAGAYNAAMLALNPVYLRVASVEPARLRGLIGLAGPYDFLPLTGPVTRAVFGFPDTAITTQPIHFASSSAPPALLLTGAQDTLVDPGNSVRLAARLQQHGVPARVIQYPGLGHSALIGALAAPLRGLAPVLDDISGFVNERSFAATAVRS